MLNHRITTKPKGTAGTGAHAFAFPTMSAGLMSVERSVWAYANHGSNGTTGRSKGRRDGTG